MIMPVHDVIVRDIDHLLGRNMRVPRLLDLSTGAIALLSNGVGDSFETLGNSLTQVAVGFTNPVTGPIQGRPDRTNDRHTNHLS